MGGEEEQDGGGVFLFSRGEREDRVALTHTQKLTPKYAPIRSTKM